MTVVNVVVTELPVLVVLSLNGLVMDTVMDQITLLNVVMIMVTAVLVTV
jgi:hypothetical protein